MFYTDRLKKSTEITVKVTTD